jgi:uncharacterized protein YcgI (DUF1989 family)
MTRVVLRLNDQQRVVLDELLAHPATPDGLDAVVAASIAHDAARPPDPTRSGPRPPARPPTPRDPAARVDALVPACTGIGVALREGDVLRVEQVVDGQCADLNAFALDGSGRRFDAARTRAADGLRPTTGAVLVSTPPEVPLLRIAADTAGPHDLGFPACSAGEFAAVTAQEDHSNCVDLQRETQRHWGLAPRDVHDPLNLWLPTGVLPDGRLCWWPCAARAGDHVDLVALADVLVTVNPCASDVFGSAAWELGPIRVIVSGDGPAPAAPSGPEPRWRWTDLPVRDVPVDVGEDGLAHVAAVRGLGWLGTTDAAVVRAMLLRYWESAVLELGDVSR